MNIGIITTVWVSDQLSDADRDMIASCVRNEILSLLEYDLSWLPDGIRPGDIGKIEVVTIKSKGKGGDNP